MTALFSHLLQRAVFYEKWFLNDKGSGMSYGVCLITFYYNHKSLKYRAPRNTNNNQQKHNYFVMILATNSFIKNCYTLYAGKNKYSSSLKIFSWCSNDKHWHNIPGKITLYSTYNLVYFDHRKNIHFMYFYKREILNWNKVLMQTWSPIDRDRKGFIEYTIIPCRRLNRQVSLAVYYFFTPLIVFQ